MAEQKQAMSASDAELESAFLRSERRLRKDRAVTALSLGTLLMPLGTLIDWFQYPDQFFSLLTTRIIGTVILLLGLFTIRRPILDRYFEPVSLFLIFSPAAAMAWMMYLTDGGMSSYYFGLILLMIIVHMLGFRTKEAIVFCALTVAAYVLAVVAYPGVVTNAYLVQSIFFLLTASVVCVAVCSVSRKNRYVAFTLQNELRQERIQLEESTKQLRATESLLFQSEKVRAVAGLASGLLHEINNPVNYSLMATQVLEKRLADNPEDLETLSDIQDGVSRIGEIVSDLRSFAYPEERDVQKPFRLRRAIDKAVRFSANELELGLVEIVQSDAIDAMVVGAEGQLTQVFLNLLLNGRSAIQGNKQSPAIRVQAIRRGDRIAISVSDTGIGMSPDQIVQVREPFFTTRAGKGLGLGLSICDAIIRAHGGELAIESEVGKGTTIAFHLAAYDSAELSRPSAGPTSVCNDGEPMRENPMRENPMRENPMRENPVRENPVRQNVVQQNTETRGVPKP